MARPTKSKQQKQKTTSSGAAKKTPRLGRGLSALMGQPFQVVPPLVPDGAQAKAGSSEPNAVTDGSGGVLPSREAVAPASLVSEAQGRELVQIPINLITANPHQPRKNFREESLHQLAESIRQDGLIQPIVVRSATGSVSDGQSSVSGQTTTQYELVAGERRLRAAEIAGISHLPAIVREMGDHQAAQWALIENLQREDLNPIERGEGFKHLIDAFHLSHDEVAKRVGIDRSTISNLLRILSLCDKVKRWVADGLISTGQAKVIVGLTDSDQQELVAQRAISQGWSVRRVEAEIKRLGAGGVVGNASTAKSARSTPVYLQDLEQQISQQLQTKAKIRPGRKKGSGTLSIDFYSLDQFDALVQRLNINVAID